MHFDAMYGMLWTKRFNNEEHLHFCKQQWSIALANASNQQLHKAIQLCLQDKILPPSLPEFKQMCRQYAVIEHKPVSPVLTLKRNDELARKHLAVIRVTLGMSFKENLVC